MKKTILFFIVSICSCLTALAQTEEEIPPPPPPPPPMPVVKQAHQDSTQPKLADFIKEIQQVDNHDYAFSMVMWMPWQYWHSAFVQAVGELNPAQIEMINTMKNYTIIIVCEGEINKYTGGMFYKPESMIRDSITMRFNDSIVLKPIPQNNLNEQLLQVFNVMDPMMKNMLGEMGGHLCYFAFENVSRDGKYIMDAQNPGKFSISWSNEATMHYRLPLEVLSTPKYCPVDKEKLSSKFDFCPYHGVKLSTRKK
jgi:hypothetical protein